MSETADIVSPLIESLNAIPGVWARRMHSGKVRARGGYVYLGATGAPDIFALVRGRALFLEAKLPKGLVTEAQLAEHGRIRQAGGVVVVVRSVRDGIDAVREMLAKEVA